MTLIQLRHLVAIVDAGFNITVAARQANATQPGLSKQIRQMEDEFGLPLFLRRGKSLEGLTAAGAQVVERARLILAEAANIRALAANHRQEAGGELRIATTYTQARFVLPPAIAGLRRRFPGVGVRLAPSSGREALERVEQGAADLAIVSSPDRPDTANLALALYRWDLVGLHRPEAPPLQIGRSLSLATLATLPLVTYESALEPDASFTRAFAEAGLKPLLACTARDSDLIKTYVRAGLGLGVLAEMAVTPEDSDLKRLSLGALFPVRTTWVVLRRERVQRNPVLELLGELAPHLERRDLRRAFDEAGHEKTWGAPPRWRDLYPALSERAAPPALKLVSG